MRYDDDDLEDEFPLGDGTAETDATVDCPHCGAPVEVALDPGGGATQDYVEDCEVCCQPWSVRVSVGGDGEPNVVVSRLDEG